MRARPAPSRSALLRCGWACAALVFALLAACASLTPSGSRPATGGESPVAEAKAAAKGKEPGAEPPRESEARSIDGYKRDAARRVYFRNTPYLFDGPPPPVLKSVVVLSIRIDARGMPVHVAVMRSNGFRDLEQRAIRSVHEAAPLPIPRSSITRRGSMEYVETWLFRNDGRFQIRSLAEVQASVDR